MGCKGQMGEGDELKQSSGFRRQRQLEGANVLGFLVLIFLYSVVCLATAACRVGPAMGTREKKRGKKNKSRGCR